MNPQISTTASGDWLPGLLENGTIFPVMGMIFGCILLFTLLCGGMCIAFVKALRGGGSTQKLRHLEHQETRSFQELERGFRRMEERVDSLETLLIGRSTQPNYTTEREFE